SSARGVWQRSRREKTTTTRRLLLPLTTTVTSITCLTCSGARSALSVCSATGAQQLRFMPTVWVLGCGADVATGWIVKVGYIWGIWYTLQIRTLGPREAIGNGMAMQSARKRAVPSHNRFLTQAW